MPTHEQCRKQIFNTGIKLGVSPKLISTRLLSVDDKEDMLSGFVSDTDLEVHVLAWMHNKMPDYANGSTIAYTAPKELPMQRYRGNGKS
jgi:hypothetical protein